MALKKKVLVALGLDDRQYRTRMAAASKELEKTTRKMERDGRRLSLMSRDIFMGLTIPLGIFGKSVFDATSKLEKMQLGLETIARSRGIGGIQQLREEVERLAELPGLGLEETFQAMQQLLGVGASAGTASKIIEGFGIGIARAGGSAQEFNRVMTQMTQALSKGQLQMQDFKTAFEQLPEGRRILEDAFGPGMSDLENLRAAGIPVAQVVEMLAEGFQRLGADGFIDTMANSTENLSMRWLILRSVIGKEIFGSTFKQGLNATSEGMKRLTTYIRTMSPETKQLVANFTKLSAIIGLIIPAMSFLASRMKIMGALLLRNSVLVGGLAKGFKFMSISLGLSNVAASKSVLAFSSMGRAILAARGAFSALSKVIKFGIPILGELLLIFEALRLLIPSFDRAVRNFIPTIEKSISVIKARAKALEEEGKNLPLLRALWEDYGRAFDSATDGKTFGPQATGPMGPFAATAEILEEVGHNAAKASDVTDDFIETLGDLGTKAAEVKPIFDGLSVSLDDFLKGSLASAIQRAKTIGKLMGDSLTTDGMKLPGRSFGVTGKPGDITPLGGGIGATSTVPGLSDQDLQIAQQLADKWDVIRQAANETTVLAAQQGQAIKDLWIEPISAGLDGLANAFGAFADTVLSGGKDAWESFAKAAKAAIKQMIVDLIVLIAKMLIVKALSAALGIKGGGGDKDDDDDSGGGSFFKKLFKSFLGFSRGGVVPGTSYSGDRVLARLNSGEMVLTKDQQKAIGNMMSNPGIILGGNFVIRGRDLVYVLEANQAQLNGSR